MPRPSRVSFARRFEKNCDEHEAGSFDTLRQFVSASKVPNDSNLDLPSKLSRAFWDPRNLQMVGRRLSNCGR